MRRVPIVATTVVVLAVAAMIGLGLWQLLDRRPQKIAYLQQLAANPERPVIAFPDAPDDRLLFRRATGFCHPPVAIRKAGAGAQGFRAIVTCAHETGEQAMTVQLGTSRDPKAVVDWPGGPVSGFISHAPDSRPLIAGLFDHRPRQLMLTLDHSVAGLSANGEPDISSVPNNHLAYAVQWFFFATVATVVYVLALKRRWRD